MLTIIYLRYLKSFNSIVRFGVFIIIIMQMMASGSNVNKQSKFALDVIC